MLIFLLRMIPINDLNHKVSAFLLISRHLQDDGLLSSLEDGLNALLIIEVCNHFLFSFFYHYRFDDKNLHVL